VLPSRAAADDEGDAGRCVAQDRPADATACHQSETETGEHRAVMPRSDFQRRVPRELTAPVAYIRLVYNMINITIKILYNTETV